MVVGVFGFAGTASAKELTVGCTATDTDSIDTAVTNADPGDTIRVCSGTYTTGVTVDESDLTIVGDPGGETAGAAENAPDVDVATGDAFVVTAAADGTTIKGFDVTADDDAIEIDVESGETLKDVSISQNLVRDQIYADVDSTAEGPGEIRGLSITGNSVDGGADIELDVDDEVDAVASGIRVTDNSLTSGGKLHFDIEGAENLQTDISVRSNMIEETDDGDAIDIEINDADGATPTISIQGNTLRSSDDESIYIDLQDAEGIKTTISIVGNTITDPEGDGIKLEGDSIDKTSEESSVERKGTRATITVRDNLVEDPSGGESANDGLEFVFDDDDTDPMSLDLTVASNRIRNSDSLDDGMEFEISSKATSFGDGPAIDLTVSNNLVESVDSQGIDFVNTGGESMSARVERNDLRNNEDGIQIQGDGDASQIVVRLNNIVGNDKGIKNEDDDAVVDARRNYWGANDGPSSADEATEPLKNPGTDLVADGSGDSITEGGTAGVSNVRFDPYLSLRVDVWLAEVSEDPEFEITNSSITPDSVPAGERVNVSVTVSNVGEEEGEYTALLKDATDLLGTREAEIEPDASRTFEWTVRTEAQGTKQLLVRTHYIGEVQVTKPILDTDSAAVLEASVPRSTVLQGESYRVYATVENNGSTTGRLPIEYATNGTVEHTARPIVEWDNSVDSNHTATSNTTGTVNWSVNGVRAGTVTVVSADSVESGTIDIYATSDTVAPGEEYQVVPVIHNGGNESMNYTVALQRNGSVETLRTVEVGAGETLELPVTVTATEAQAGTTIEWQVEDETVTVAVTDG